MINEKDIRNWKISIGVDKKGISTNIVNHVTYEEACASARRQMENIEGALSFVVSEVY